MCAQGGGMNRKYRSCKMKVNTAAMLVIKNKCNAADGVFLVLQMIPPKNNMYKASFGGLLKTNF